MNIDWLKRHIRDFDFMLVIILLCISVFSVLAVYSATAKRAGMENWYIKEIMWQILSYIFMFVFVLVDYRMLRNRVAWIGYWISLVLLIAVFAFPSVNGAHSWIILPGIQFQPSEFAKIFVILVISDYMAKVKEKEERFGFKHFSLIALIVGVPFALILKEPALGQALVLLGIMGAMLILFLEKRQLVLYCIMGALLVTSVFMVMSVYPDQTIRLIQNTPLDDHQKERIITFVDPEADPQNGGWQALEAKIAIGAGQLFGRGLLNGSQTQGEWVPEQWTDFIFSAIGEELGFVGSSTLVFLFFLLLNRMIRIASTVDDDFAIHFIAGAVGMFTFQIYENIGMNLSLMPVAGITLPFVSYGGTSLLTNFVVVGIVLSIAIRRRKLVF
ncbi:rod shape-determining protein RodA [Collibacillus ludicampi]|uniref:Rod shape-determining protein RodA n=1 Tax=Collibacillus ludicampi TaxID=2771369 RepID=A0AAV4LAN4_9BACL|nr:rod shape-determining protein RodA [Collibacillus ludicampi]GIM44840.1 rod shape-determining protein RodA [Collibacillus ludicampi]